MDDMDRLTVRWQVVIGIGVLMVLISLFADSLGLGSTLGFGRVQTIGVIVGALVIVAGFCLRRRPKPSP